MPSTHVCDPGATILLAEDDVIIRIVVADYLRGCGFRVIEAAGGVETKTVLQHGPDIHVLLTDARLAGDDNGFTLARWTRTNRPNIRVIMCVSLAQKAEAASALCSGSQKPALSVMHLRERVEAMKARRGRRVRPDDRPPRARLAYR